MSALLVVGAAAAVGTYFLLGKKDADIESVLPVFRVKTTGEHTVLAGGAADQRRVIRPPAERLFAKFTTERMPAGEPMVGLRTAVLISVRHAKEEPKPVFWIVLRDPGWRVLIEPKKGWEITQIRAETGPAA